MKPSDNQTSRTHAPWDDNAWRSLLEAMPSHIESEAFGLAGNDPDSNIYDVVFRSTGIHSQVEPAKWQLGAPSDPRWKPIWYSINKQFEAAVDRRVSVAKIIVSLPSPPADPREDVLNGLLVAALLTRRDDILLYEHNNLVLTVDASIANRLWTKPGRFSIRNSQTRSGQRNKLMNILIRRLDVRRNFRDPSLLDLIIVLYSELKQLPAYSLQTKRGLSRDTLSVRQCFQGAVEPDVLLFETIPVVLMIEPFVGSENLNNVSAGEYTAGLTKAIRELKNAYPALLNEVLRAMAQELGLSERLDEFRGRLTTQAHLVAERMLDPTLDSFVKAIREPRTDQVWLEGVAAVIALGNPPKLWDDVMADNFCDRVEQVARNFRQALATGNA